MVVLRSKIEIIKKSSDNDFDWESSGSEVNYVFGTLELVDNLGASMDTFGFTVANPNGSKFSSSSLVDVGDKVNIWQWTGTGSINSSSDFMGNFIVENLEKKNEDGRYVTVRGKSFINALFNTQVFLDTSGVSVLEVTYDILSKVNEKAGSALGRWIYGQDAAEWISAGNPTGGGTGGNQQFPSFTIVRKHTTAIDLLMEVWSDKFTSDGQYMLWVEYDRDNDRYPLVVQRKSSIATGSITEGGNERRWIIEEKVDDVINVVTYMCGHDAYGNPMEFFHYDVTSMQKYGPREKYWSETAEIGRTLITNEQRTNPSSFPTDSQGDFTGTFPSSFPYTMSYNTRGDTGEVGTGSWIVSSSATYNAALRKESKWQGRKQVEAYIDQRSTPRKKLNVDYPRSATEYGISNLYEIHSPSYGYTGSNVIKLRCVRVTSTDTLIKYLMEEDEGTY